MASTDDAKIQQYLLLAKGARGRALVELIAKATSEPNLFAFGELLNVPSISDMQKVEDLSPHFNLLQLYAHGTWPQYKEQSSSLPQISPQQRLKLKQLTVVSLAINAKTISYANLMDQLDIPTIRELEDFIITECFYTTVVKGKLDQKQHCLQVHDVIGRDVRQQELQALDQGLGAWLSTCSDLMASIERQITHAQASSDAARRQRMAVEARQEEINKSLKTEMDLRGTDTLMMMDEGSGDYMDEDRIDRPMMMDRGERERTAFRFKRRILR